MADPVLVLCGGVTRADAPRGWRGVADALELRIGPGRGQVHLEIWRLAAAMRAGFPAVSADLVELAAYVYAADQARGRGGLREFEYGSKWRRHLKLVVPVRAPAAWGRPDVGDALRAALGFLMDDEVEFAFVRATDPAQVGAYLFDDAPVPAGGDFEEVVLFSGGLDSLAGAVEEVLVGRRRVALVSHRPVGKVAARQADLVRAIRGRLPRTGLSPLHVGVTANKAKQLGREFTQRSRSFLFASFAAVVARQLGLNRVRFYENGVTSLNLPVSPQLLGGRASRTTHPQTLARFGRLFSLLFDTGFTVENPFQWVTKAGMLARLKASGHADLCRLTSSCVHTWTQTTRHPHCGLCSQCVDRRVSAVAAGLTDEQDPAGGYEVDVVTGERDGPDLTFLERYIGSAFDVGRLSSAVAFAARFGEVSRAVPYLGLPADEAVGRVHELYREHAAGVCRALKDVHSRHLDVLHRLDYPSRSLLGVSLGRAARPPAGTAVPPPPVPATPGGRLEIDSERFEVRFAGQACPLGNTHEFRLAQRLVRARDKYVSVADLRADVWGGDDVEKNTIQRTASNLRRKLRGIGLDIDGRTRDHYRLDVPAPPPAAAGG